MYRSALLLAIMLAMIGVFNTYADTVFVSITPNTSPKLRKVVLEEFNLLKKNHKVIFVPFDKLENKTFNGTLIIAGEGFSKRNFLNVKAKLLVLDFCNSCYAMTAESWKSQAYICSNTPILWFGLGKDFYKLKKFDFGEIKKAIAKDYKPYIEDINYWLGFVEFEFKNGSKKEILHLGGFKKGEMFKSLKE